MNRSRLSLGLALVVASGALFIGIVSCVGDEPTASDSPGQSDSGDRGGSPDGSTAVDAGATKDPGADAGVTCKSSETLCGSSCVDLTSSADNCNRCGRSCGGATCTGHECAVALVRDNIASLGGFDVDATSLYFTSADTINSCPLGACTGGVTQIGATGQYPAGEIYQDSGFVYFQSAPVQSTERPAIYRCSISGCANPPASLMGDGLNGIGDYKTFGKSVYAYLGGSGIQRVDCSSGTCTSPSLYVPRRAGNNAFAVDAQRIYFNDPTDGGTSLSSCPLAPNCTTKAGISTAAVLGPIVVVGDTIYFIGPGFTSGGMSVLACATTGACSNPKALRKTAIAIPNLAADASGIFWTEDDKLLMCGSVDCVGGPKTLATGLASPSLLHLDAAFVYFATTGTNADTSAIRRIARP